MNKKIGPFLATMLVASTMMGSGIFLLPASLGAIGSISIVSWIVATLGAACLAFVFSALAMADPSRPGLFSYIRDAFGPGSAFVIGALYWASCAIANVAIAVAISGYLSVFIPAVASPTGSAIATIAFLWLFLGVNAIGPRFVAQLQSWVLPLGLVPVFIVAIFGWFYFHPATFLASWNVSGASAFRAVPRATVMVFWAFVGLETAIVLSKRVRNPARDVPIATIGGLAIAATIYMSACAAIMGILPASVLVKSSAPFADAVAPMLGNIVAGVVALCAMLKASGTLGSTTLLTLETAECESVMGQARAGFVQGDKSTVPNIVFTGVLTSLVTLASASPTLARQFTIVTDVCVVLTVLVYGAAALALLRMSGALPRKTQLWVRPLAVAGTLFCVWLIVVSEPDLLICSAAAILAAIVAYLSIRFRRMQVARTPSGA
jgi:arginine:agmatine antiporter